MLLPHTVMLSLGQTSLLVLVAIKVALCFPLYDTPRYVLKESHSIPDGWYSEGLAPSQHVIHLQLGLTSDGFEKLERHLLEGMSTYGGYMSMRN